MKFKILSELCFISFFWFLIMTCCVFASDEAEPKLSRMTCQDYWDYRRQTQSPELGPSEREKLNKKYFEELIEAWNFNVQIFREKNPSLYNAELFPVFSSEDFYSMPPSLGFHNALTITRSSCDIRVEKPTERFRESIQNRILKFALMEKQKSHVGSSGCSVTPARSMSIFVPEKKCFLTACIQSFGSVTVSSNKGNHAALFCFKPLNNKDKKCVTVLPTLENVCLSQYGLCTKKSGGDCGWVHTDASRACMRKETD